MNKDRRKAIEAALKHLEGIDAAISSAVEDLEAVRDEEQEAYDGLPESFQNGERGEAMMGCIQGLDSMIEALQEAQSQIEQANDAVSEARGE